MKVLHLRSSEFFGGPERAILGQCRHLKSFRGQVASFVRRGKENRFLDTCRAEGVDAWSIPEAFPGDFRTIAHIRRLLDRENVDIIVTHDYKSNFYGFFAVRGGRCRQVAHFRGRTAEDLKVKVYNSIDWIILRKIGRIFVVSEHSRRQLEARGIRPRVIRVVFNAIDCQGAEIGRPAESTADDRSLNVVAAGRLSYEKGLDILLKAVPLVDTKARPFQVEIYGHGPEKGRLRKMAAALNVSGKVVFRGFVDDIKPIFRQADWLVLPSRSEGMPNVILEAWSQKLAVLATAVGGVPEMIEDGINGLLVPPENPRALADKLISAMSDPEIRITCGENGWRTARDHYNYEKQARLLEELYREYMNA